jgi:hypothetical protein
MERAYVGEQRVAGQGAPRDFFFVVEGAQIRLKSAFTQACIHTEFQALQGTK